MKIVNSNSIPLQQAQHGPYMKQVFVGNNEIPNLEVFGKVVIKPGQTAGDHGHDGKSEVYFIQKGKGKIIFNKSLQNDVVEGDIVVTNANETHELSNPFEEDLELLFLEVKG